ncbi:E3 ubiquitin-protein ligase pellino 1 [Batrachochytrium dendrobatidis]|nr:E3 ubiquitin-protein ligase pellino 1 [Batrachochytrium dendrobatidis]KAK5670537.1 E3 ubiquitin-protein ligase pellino 1 [Batrachochytrium dendrobatidis]
MSTALPFSFKNEDAAEYQGLMRPSSPVLNQPNASQIALTTAYINHKKPYPDSTIQSVTMMANHISNLRPSQHVLTQDTLQWSTQSNHPAMVSHATSPKTADSVQPCLDTIDSSSFRVLCANTPTKSLNSALNPTDFIPTLNQHLELEQCTRELNQDSLKVMGCNTFVDSQSTLMFPCSISRWKNHPALGLNSTTIMDQESQSKYPSESLMSLSKPTATVIDNCNSAFTISIDDGSDEILQAKPGTLPLKSNWHLGCVVPNSSVVTDQYPLTPTSIELESSQIPVPSDADALSSEQGQSALIQSAQETLEPNTTQPLLWRSSTLTPSARVKSESKKNRKFWTRCRNTNPTHSNHLVTLQPAFLSSKNLVSYGMLIVLGPTRNITSSDTAPPQSVVTLSPRDIPNGIMIDYTLQQTQAHTQRRHSTTTVESSHKLDSQLTEKIGKAVRGAVDLLCRRTTVTSPPVRPESDESTQLKFVDAFKPVGTVSFVGSIDVKYDCFPSTTTDMYQFGLDMNQSGADFVVCASQFSSTGTTKHTDKKKTAALNLRGIPAVRKGSRSRTSRQSGMVSLSTKPSMDKVEKDKEGFPMRIVCSRQDLADARLYAGMFDSTRSIVCTDTALMWSVASHTTQTSHYACKQEGSDSIYDAFPTGSSVLLWRPIRSKEGIIIGGKWMEISIMGNAFQLRSDSKVRGAPMTVSDFPDIKDATTQLNQLIDGCIIYCESTSFLWRSPHTTTHGYTKKVDFTALTTNDMLDQVKQFSNGLVCPITLDSIPTSHIAVPIREPSVMRYNIWWLIRRMRWLDLLRCRNFKRQSMMDIRARSTHLNESSLVLEGQPFTAAKWDDVTDTYMNRPWCFSQCGHVFSLYDHTMMQPNYTSACSVCRSEGGFMPLTLGLIPGIVMGNITHAISPCGHMLDTEMAALCTGRAGVRFPFKGDSIPLHDRYTNVTVLERENWIESVMDNVEGLSESIYTLLSDPAQHTSNWTHRCPFCFSHISSVCKLYFQNDPWE